MNIDKDIIGKPPNQAIVINDKLINRQSKEKEDHSKDNKVLSEPFTDSRKKLESEIAEKVCSYEKAAGTWHPELMECTYDNVLHWLDRQAAITERNCQMDYEDMRDYLQAQVDNMTAERNEFADELKLDAIALDELRKQVDELTTERDLWNKRARQAHEHALGLTAERDELQKRLLAALNTADTIAKDTNDIKKERDRLVDERYRYRLQCERWESKIAMLEAERDHLKKVVQQQAESFRKMEVELSKAKAVSNECDR